MRHCPFVFPSLSFRLCSAPQTRFPMPDHRNVQTASWATGLRPVKAQPLLSWIVDAHELLKYPRTVSDFDRMLNMATGVVVLPVEAHAIMEARTQRADQVGSAEKCFGAGMIVCGNVLGT